MTRFYIGAEYIRDIPVLKAAYPCLRLEFNILQVHISIYFIYYNKASRERQNALMVKLWNII
ncbi:MAG TPA: hypothetical protein VGD33_10265 [Chitinophagaceae bacterium]